MSGRVTGWNIYMVLLNKKLFAVTNHFSEYINFIYISFALDFLLNLGLYTLLSTATPNTLLPYTLLLSTATPLYGYSLYATPYTLLPIRYSQYATPNTLLPIRYSYTHSIHHYFISITIYASQIK